MSFSYIQSKIAAIGTISGGTLVTVDQTFSGSAQLIAVFQDSFGQDHLDLKCHYLDSQSDYLRLTGYVDILGVANMEFDLKIRDLGSDYSFVMQLLIPGGWVFSDSFGEIPLLEEGNDETEDALTLMDTFPLSSSWLIFSNTAGMDPDLGIELVKGIHFKGGLVLTGMFGRLASLLDIQGPIALAGPVKEYLAASEPLRFTGIQLGGEIPCNFDLGGLSVQSSRLLIKSPIRPRDGAFQTGLMAKPGIYFLFSIEVDGRPLEIICNYDPIGADSIYFHGYFSDFAIGGLSTLDNTLGGEGLNSAAPQEIGTPSGLNITEFGFCLGTSSKKLAYIFVGVGCGNTWTLVPDWLSLSQLGMRFTVNSPFNAANRSFSTSVSGVMDIGNVGVEMMVSYPSLDFVIRKDAEDTLSLGDLLGAIAPGLGDLPAVNIQTLTLEGNASRKSAKIIGQATELGSFPIGNATFSVDGVAFYVDYVRGGNSSGSLHASMSLGQAKGDLIATIDNETILAGTLTNVSLHNLYMEITGDSAVPDELPEVNFETLNLTYNLTTKAFAIEGAANIVFDKLPFDSAINAQVEFKVAHTLATGGQTQATGYTILVSVNGTGPVSFADGFSLETFTLLFNYQTQTGWQLGGTFHTILCDQPIALAASYASTANGKQLSLGASTSQEIALISMAGMFEYKWSRLELSVATQAIAGGGSQKAWALRLDSKLAIPSVATMAGALEIASDGAKKSLRFRSTHTDFYSFTIADGVGMGFRPVEIGLTKESAESGWQFMGRTDLRITGVPGKLGTLLPQFFTAVMTLGKTDTKIEVLNALAPFNFQLPEASGQPLGTMVLELRSIGVSLRPAVGFTCTLGLGFPKELNTYFGHQVFREYEAGNPLSMAQLVTTVSGSGIDLKFLTSPFLSGNASTAQGEAWLDFDWGEYGAIKMKLPSFRYDMASSYFEASGGFQIVRDLWLPLTPLRNFLKAVGMEGALNIFPEKLPVKGISLVDSSNNLKTSSLITFLEKAGSIPADVKTALLNAGNILNRLPDGFKSYLRFQIPTSLTFKFGFSPYGRVALGLQAPEEPIRFLYPGVVQGLVPMPGMIGIELRKLTVGTLASGTLFYGEIDAIIDQYDMPSLVATLSLPTDRSFPLPTSDEIHRRILLRDVFSIIPLSQGVPVPVPVFYDEIGFEYKGIEGIGIGAHIGIPKPDFAKGGAAAIQLFSEFFKDRNLRLDPQTPPGGQDIKFKFRDEFLQAPEYLGNGKVGATGPIEVGLWKYVANLMNFCKFFSIEDFIPSVPLENRVANKRTKFACFELDGQYLITTPSEFARSGYAALNLDSNQAGDFMDVLPGVQTSQTSAGAGGSGLVMFLRGAVDSPIFGLEATFGLAASGTMGFNTGFKLEGHIGGFIEAELKGALLLNAPKVENSVQYPASDPVEAATIVPTVVARRQGKALSFNGTNSMVSFDYDKAPAPLQYTIEVWLKLSKTGTSQTIIAKQFNGYQLSVADNGVLIHFFRSTHYNGQEVFETPEGSFAFDTWQHVAVTNNGKTARIFVNGIQKAEYTSAYQTVVYTAGFEWGKLPRTNRLWLKGQMAEMRIWKRALSQQSLLLGMNRRLKGDESSLLAYYPLDADTGTQILDCCGLNHGTGTNTSFVNTDLNLFDGLEFDGVGDQIVIPEFNKLKENNCTVQLVLRVDPSFIGEAGHIFGGNQNAFGIFTAANGNLLNTGHSLAPYLGKQIVITQTRSALKRITYIDGTKIKEEALSQSDASGLATLYLGRNGKDRRPFKGEISELRIWDSTLSADKVQARLHNWVPGTETGLIGHYRPAKARNGELQSEGKGAPGKVDVRAVKPALAPYGLQFSDKSQYAYVPTSDKFGPLAYTIEFWFRPEAANNDLAFLVRFPGDGGPRLAYNGLGYLSMRFVDKGGFKMLEYHGAPWELNTWHHVACTNDGTKAILYLDGEKKAELTGLTGLLGGSSDMVVGRAGPHGDASNFLGRIDEIRYWSVARTLEQIQYDMFQPLSGKEAGLVAYYPFDGRNGAQMRDHGPNGIHGTIYGMNLPTVPKSPAASGRSLVQGYGHSHLKIGGHEVMVADLRIQNNEFWFKGTINLFPASWPVKIFGQAEALIGKDKFFLSSDTQVQLFGLNLMESKLLITHERAYVAGKWLGIDTLLDIQWAGDNPHFTGMIEAEYKTTLALGAIYIKGVKVADNFKLRVDLGFHISLDFDKNQFGGTVKAKFKIEGVGFEFSFTISAAPPDLDGFANWVRDEIAGKPEQYLAHIFADALEYAKEVWNDTVEFFEDSTQAFGNALSSAYQQTAAQAAAIWKGVGATAGDAVALLATGYNQTVNGIATCMQGAGYVYKEIGDALANAGQSMNEIAGALMNIKVPLDDIGKYFTAAGKTLEQVASALNAAGAGIVDLAKSLKNLGATVDQIAGWYNNLGKSLDGIVKTLKEVGFVVESICTALKNLGKSVENIYSSMLKAGNYAWGQMGRGINAMVNSLEETARILDKYAYPKEIGYAFKDGFAYTSKQVATLFKNVWNDATRTLIGVTQAFSKGVQDACSELKDIGFNCDRVSEALKHQAFNYSSDAASKLLKNIGYSNTDICKAMKNVYNVGYEGCIELMISIGMSSYEAAKLVASIF